MSNIHYNWNEIESDCIKIIAKQIAESKKIPSSFPALHELLKVTYTAEGKDIPSPNTFRQVMHDRLRIGNNQKNISAVLYRLAGKYDKMTLAQLTENITLTSGKFAVKSPWIFIKMNNSDIGNMDKSSHLYRLSHELKKKFSSDILFISFDNDTIVVLCSSGKAMNKILAYFEKNAVCERITIDRGDGNGNESNV